MRKAGYDLETFASLIESGQFDVSDVSERWRLVLPEVLATDASDILAALDPEVMPPVEADDDATFMCKIFSQGYRRLWFSGLVGKFMAYGLETLLRRVGNRADLAALGAVLETRLRTDLLNALANRLLAVSARTLLLELNVARIHDRLPGDSPQQRYRHYARVTLTDPVYLETLFGEYPVLGRCMVATVETWVDNVVEVLARLVADEPRLRSLGLLTAELTDLDELRMDLGDPHAGGRAVAQLSFAGGKACAATSGAGTSGATGTRLIYKPRSVATEEAYLATVALVNRYRPAARLGGMRVLERRGYGWCEYIEHHGCEDEAAYRRFYRRSGGVLAVMLFLGAVDFHLENIIASGEHCVPIDLETILQHVPARQPATDAHGKAVDLLNRSVLAIGMLPDRAFGNRVRQGVDVSAIGGGLPQDVPRPVPMVVDEFSDVARIEPVIGTMLGASNRPFIVDGPAVRPERYIEDVVAGFVEVYEIIEAHRPEFGALLASFAEVEVRYLARPTRRYSLFLTESYHPNHMRDGLDRERLLDRLWVAAEGRPELIGLIESEKHQLLFGDIPCFRTTAGGTAVHGADGAVAEGFFAQPSTVAMTERLAAMGPVHLATQVRIIRDTMHTLVPPSPTVVPAQIEAEPGPDDADAARTIATVLLDRLADEAILGADDVNWIGVSIESIQDESFAYKPLGTNLYDGLAGLAMAFGYASVVTGGDRYRDLARRAIAPVVGHLGYARRMGSVEPVGAYSGLGGMLYAVDHLAQITGDAQYREALVEAGDLFLRCAREETCPDLIAGMAGGGLVALDMYRRYGVEEYRLAAEACADGLRRTAVDVEGAAGWRVTHDGDVLGGLSHGSAGIGMALIELGGALDDPALSDLGWRAVGFDRRLFVPAGGAWQDLRRETDQRGYPAQWCHGSCGIGMSRLAIMRSLGRRAAGREAGALAGGGLLAEPGALTEASALTAEAGFALAHVRDFGFGGNHSLCHGDLGALDLFETAAGVLPNGHDYAAQRARLAAGTLARLAERGPVTGLAAAVDMPGLMLGTAGIAYGLLRLSDPDVVPSVLRLDPADHNG